LPRWEWYVGRGPILRFQNIFAEKNERKESAFSTQIAAISAEINIHFKKNSKAEYGFIQIFWPKRFHKIDTACFRGQYWRIFCVDCPRGPRDPSVPADSVQNRKDPESSKLPARHRSTPRWRGTLPGADPTES
jgi:hypothetical protein